MQATIRVLGVREIAAGEGKLWAARADGTVASLDPRRNAPVGRAITLTITP